MRSGYPGEMDFGQGECKAKVLRQDLLGVFKEQKGMCVWSRGSEGKSVEYEAK